MKLKLYLILTCLSFVFTQCRNEAPVEWNMIGSDSSLAIPVSYYELPVEYPIEKFEEWLNEKIQGTFFSKGLPVNGGADSIYLDITKKSNIRIQILNEKLDVEIPVIVKGFYQKNLAGFKLKNKEAIEAELVIRLVSAVDIDRNWHILLKSKLKSIEWVKNPHLNVLGIKMDLKNIIHKQLMERSDELTGKLDEGIRNKVNLTEPMEKVWHDIQKPIFLHKYHPQAWMKILGEKVSARIDLGNPHALVFHLKVEGRNYAILDSNALPKSSKLPKLEKLHRKADSFFIVIHGEIPFELATTVLNEKLKNQKVEKGGYAITIARLDMKGTDSGLVVRVKVKGDIRGYLYLIGTPAFIPVEQKLKIENFRFLVETSDNLLNAADLVLHDALMAYLEDYLEFDLMGPLSSVPDLIHQGIEKGKAGKRMDLQISALEISAWRLLLNEKNIQFQIDTRGKASIEIENLKAKKKVKIS